MHISPIQYRAKLNVSKFNVKQSHAFSIGVILQQQSGSILERTPINNPANLRLGVIPKFSIFVEEEDIGPTRHIFGKVLRLLWKFQEKELDSPSSIAQRSDNYSARCAQALRSLVRWTVRERTAQTYTYVCIYVCVCVTVRRTKRKM